MEARKYDLLVDYYRRVMDGRGSGGNEMIPIAAFMFVMGILINLFAVVNMRSLSVNWFLFLLVLGNANMILGTALKNAAS